MLVCCCTDPGHAILVLACRNGGTCSNLDCIFPEKFEGYKGINFAAVAAKEDPHLVLFWEESRAIENTDTDVDCVLVYEGVA